MSIIGAADHGTGLIMLAACGSLVVLGPNIPPETVSRMLRPVLGWGPTNTWSPAAAPERALVPGEAGRASAFGRVAVSAALAAMILVSGLALGASALEQWGRTHYGEWSLRASLRLQPRRLSATEFLSRKPGGGRIHG